MPTMAASLAETAINALLHEWNSAYGDRQGEAGMAYLTLRFRIAITINARPAGIDHGHRLALKSLAMPICCGISRAQAKDHEG